MGTRHAWLKKKGVLSALTETARPPVGRERLFPRVSLGTRLRSPQTEESVARRGHHADVMKHTVGDIRLEDRSPGGIVQSHLRFEDECRAGERPRNVGMGGVRAGNRQPVSYT